MAAPAISGSFSSGGSCTLPASGDNKCSVAYTPAPGSEGTHTITAFWEYLLLLETCHKILAQDEVRHMRNGQLYEPYRRLADTYGEDDFVSAGDFGERMLKLTQRIAEDFERAGEPPLAVRVCPRGKSPNCSISMTSASFAGVMPCASRVNPVDALRL